MTEFITTFPSDVTNAAYVKNLCTAAFNGTESTITSTGADSRYQRIVDTGAPIAGLEFTFSIEVRKPGGETVTGARLLISDAGFSDLLTQSFTLTDNDTVEGVTHTFGGGTGGNSIVIRIDYPEPQQGTNGHQIIVKNHSLTDSASPSVDSIDSDGEVTDGQGIATLTTSNFGADISSVLVDDSTYTTANLFIGGAAGSWTWTVPDLLNLTLDTAPNQPNWLTGTTNLIASDGSDNANLGFNYNQQADTDVVTVAGAVDTVGSIFEGRGSLPTDGSVLYYSNLNNTSVSPSGIYTSDANSSSGVMWDIDTGVYELWAINLTASASTTEEVDVISSPITSVYLPVTYNPVTIIH